MATGAAKQLIFILNSSTRIDLSTCFSDLFLLSVGWGVALHLAPRGNDNLNRQGGSRRINIAQRELLGNRNSSVTSLYLSTKPRDIFNNESTWKDLHPPNLSPVSNAPWQPVALDDEAKSN